MAQAAPYGSWKSPITTDLITGKSISLVELAIDGGDVYWIESRPLEGGRYTIMRRTPDGSISECTPPGFYARTTVHEYGGGAFTVAGGTLYFANFKDQHLYRQRLGGQPELLTPGEGYRYADLVVDRRRDRLICIREDHAGAGEAVNTIVSIDLKSPGNGAELVEGNNFYSTARLSPDGSKLAYLTWNHPNMPWDGCELWMADVQPDGALARPRHIAGGPAESLFQPEWSPDGVLYCVMESSGWWNLYRLEHDQPRPVCPMQAEFGEPQWLFGTSMYGFDSAARILCCYSQDGIRHLAWLDPTSGKLSELETGYTDFDDIRIGPGFAAFFAGSPTHPSAVVRMDTATGRLQTIRQAFEAAVDPGYISIAQSISFPTEGGRQAHGIYYAPQNKDYIAPQGERPPLMVISHGGPTGATVTTLRYSTQYWTSRGFAVLDVNYGGSVGYGREYRRRLLGNWGIVDVDDCCNGALHLAKEGLVDRNRLAIRGASAGGYTTLACLTFRPDIFKAGASHYGLSELEVFATDTHKFESHYMDTLIGPYPQKKDLYFRRSPIHFIDRIAAPIILFQGSEDRVVPPSQAEMMYEALRRKGIAVAYLLFEGEQHGFRRAENIKRSLEAELYFYSKVFGFRPADPIEPVAIQNL